MLKIQHTVAAALMVLATSASAQVTLSETTSPCKNLKEPSLFREYLKYGIGYVKGLNRMHMANGHPDLLTGTFYMDMDRFFVDYCTKHFPGNTLEQAAESYFGQLQKFAAQKDKPAP